MKSKLKTGIVTLMMLAFMAACATQQSPEQTTYSTLAMAQTTDDAVLTIAGTLYKQGQITVAQKDIIVKKANEYKRVHNLAVDAFLMYKKSGLPSDQKNYLLTLGQASQLLIDYLNFISPFIK
jgi:hypothetical protein